MSFLSSAKNDNCYLNKHNQQSKGPGEYMLSGMNPNCEPCFPLDPQVGMGFGGVAMCERDKRVDLESDLMNITRPYSECPEAKYAPKGPYCELQPMKECNFLQAENTRLSMDTCFFNREIGINRWEWMCQNEQDRAIEPFPQTGTVNTRMIVRDNHRPCIPKPLDQTLAHPSPKDTCITDLDKFKGLPDPNNYSKNPRPCQELNF